MNGWIQMTNNDQLQKIILTIATELININVNQFERVINETLGLVGAFLSVDRVYVFEYDHHKKIMNNTFEWCNHNVKCEIKNLQNVDMNLYKSGWVEAHLKGQHVIYESLSTLLPGHPVYDILASQEVKSITTIPLMENGQCLGFVGFDDITKERQWNHVELSLLKFLAEMITNAMLKQKSQEELLALKDEEYRAITEKNQFLAKISHEFRTPLHGIKNALYLLESTQLTSEQKDYFDIATFSTDSLVSMINDILDIAKIESGQIEVLEHVFDLENELTNIMLTQQIIAQEKGIIVSFNFDYTINNYLKGDFAKLRQIVLNLVNNAIKYTNQGYVSVDVIKTKETKTHVNLELIIKDSGIGIEFQDQERIFNKFYQVDSGNSRNYEGAGLGLSIVKELLKQLGGSISLDSRTNEGSTFKISLNFKKDKVYDFHQVKNLRVLVADEDKTTLSMNRMLSSMNMKVSQLNQAEKEYNIILFNQEKSQIDLDTYLDKFGQPDTIIVTMNQFNYVYKENRSIYFNPIVSRSTVYQKIIIKKDNKKNEIEDLYLKELSGYALVVDDNRLNRVVLENILEKQGIKSRSVDSGFKAIEAVQKERFDIILMDIQMPKMDGMETSNKIRDLGPQFKYLPIIAVTANVFLNDYDLMKNAQMNDVLFKPIHIDQLERILRKYMNKQSQIFIPQTQVIFDKDDYEYRFDGSFNIAKDVVETFMDTYLEDMNKIKHAINSHLAKETKETIHYFKGSCAYLSGKRASWLLSAMMDMSNKNDFEQLHKAYEILSYEVLKLVEVLECYLENL